MTTHIMNQNGLFQTHTHIDKHTYIHTYTYTHAHAHTRLPQVHKQSMTTLDAQPKHNTQSKKTQNNRKQRSTTTGKRKQENQHNLLLTCHIHIPSTTHI